MITFVLDLCRDQYVLTLAAGFVLWLIGGMLMYWHAVHDRSQSVLAHVLGLAGGSVIVLTTFIQATS
jgi:hypothetical protein